MKYTSPLLQKFISINDTPQNIAKNFILKTCEIEEIYERKISESIVIGYVTTCEKHPDADKLSVCQVDCGAKGTYQICCGGLNVAAGLYVPVALPGTVFEQAGITIQPRKMRGVESNGMICSKEELGILEDMEKHSIWSLTEDLDAISPTDLGTPLRDKFPRLENWVMEVDNKSLTNRPDLTGHFGAAIELNAIYNLVESQKSKDQSQYIGFNKIKEYCQQCNPTHIMQLLEHSSALERKVVAETDGLNTYILLHLGNVSLQQTSFFTRLQMLDLGANPINNWVDFSNLFMNISGQPVHFFDAAKVDGDIIVRNAKDGEKFMDLFATEHILKASDVVIADKTKILALAGVVGGLESGITENTKDILVEIANFDPVAIRKTGTRLGLRTDAELRYEKNINPRYSLFCLILFLDELKYYAKDLGTFSIGGLAYYIHDKVKNNHTQSIDLDIKTMEQFIFGQKIKGFDKQVLHILEGLGIGYNTQQSTCSIPLRRGPDDLNIAEDIYEEVARIYGYDQIPSLPLLSDTKYIPYTEYVQLQRTIEDIMVRTLGCNQIETYPWISQKALQEFGKNPDDFYVLQNPTNPETPYMRDDLLYGLLAHTTKNSKFFDTFRIFDIGKIRHNNTPKTTNVGQFAAEFVQEDTQLGVVLYTKNITQWNKDPLLEAKYIAQTIIQELGCPHIHFVKTTLPHFHPKKQANIFIESTTSKKEIGFVGSLHPMIAQNNKIGETSGVVYLSLNLTTLLDQLKTIPEHHYTFETLQDQIIRRDLCFVVPARQDFDAIITAVQGVPQIQEVQVFDIYAGKNLGEDKKSISIKIKITGSGDMTTDQINDIMNKAIQAGESAGGSLRA